LVIGWFRSDPLEEIVGLDTSYHGGLILMSGDDSVNPEYVSQFKKQRNEIRQRRSFKPIPHDADGESLEDRGGNSTTIGTT
jgi:hypothetical protein